MASYIALLRAVNVGGGGALVMADLVALCQGLGFTGVRTYIQSGNAVFHADGDEAAVRAALEGALQARIGKPIDVLLRSAGELAVVSAASPFPAAAGNQLLVYFHHRAPDPAVLAGLAVPGREELRLIGRDLYVHYPDGVGRSKLNLARLGVATARNLNTVARLVAMAAELEASSVG